MIQNCFIGTSHFLGRDDQWEELFPPIPYLVEYACATHVKDGKVCPSLVMKRPQSKHSFIRCW